MPSLSVTTTQTTQVQLTATQKRKLLTAIKTYTSLKQQRDTIDHAMKGHRTDVESLMEEVGESTLGIDGYKTTLIAPIRKVLDPKKLVALGVSTDIIKQATSETAGKSYVRISAPGEKEATDE